MANLKIDLEQDEVFVFTPKGKVVTLPAGATPIDFAYAIHTEVGHACIGARVNGRLVPLDSQAARRATRSRSSPPRSRAPGPSRDWLQIVATPRAANKIRQWFSRERREDAVETGREELIKALRREGLPVQKLPAGARCSPRSPTTLNYVDLDALYAAIGENHVSAKSVAARVAQAAARAATRTREEQLPTTVRGRRADAARPAPAAGVHVEGLDDVMVRLSRCCTPVPGDEIIGFVTRGRGVSVHRADCANAVSLAAGQARPAHRRRVGQRPRRRHLRRLHRGARRSTGPACSRDVSGVLADHHVNILALQHAHRLRPHGLRCASTSSSATPPTSTPCSPRISSIDSVYDAYRVLPGARAPERPLRDRGSGRRRLRVRADGCRRATAPDRSTDAPDVVPAGRSTRPFFDEHVEVDGGRASDYLGLRASPAAAAWCSCTAAPARRPLVDRTSPPSFARPVPRGGHRPVAATATAATATPYSPGAAGRHEVDGGRGRCRHRRRAGASVGHSMGGFVSIATGAIHSDEPRPA